MNNNALLMLLPFIMNGQSGNMTAVLTEIMKNQPSSINPMMLLLMSMMSGQIKNTGSKEGTDAVKGFSGEDVMNILKAMMQKDDQSV